MPAAMDGAYGIQHKIAYHCQLFRAGTLSYGPGPGLLVGQKESAIATAPADPTLCIGHGRQLQPTTQKDRIEEISPQKTDRSGAPGLKALRTNTKQHKPHKLPWPIDAVHSRYGRYD